MHKADETVRGVVPAAILPGRSPPSSPGRGRVRYVDEGFWSFEGVRWLREQGAERLPGKWRRGADGALAVRWFAEERPFSAVADWPVSHVTWSAELGVFGLQRGAMGTAMAKRFCLPQSLAPWHCDSPNEDAQHGSYFHP